MSQSTGRSKFIVIDLGTSVVKVGFGGEASPRVCLPSPFSPFLQKQCTMEEWIEVLGSFLTNLFVVHLMVRASV
jgi:actin-related protein